MVSASTASIDRATRKAELRAAAARGETTPISAIGRLRFALRALAMVLALIILLPLHYLYRTFKYGSPFPEIFLWLAARICGARIRKIGVPLRRDVFFVANHVSWIDILALAGASGTAFVAKQELGEVPVIGWLCRLNRTVFVKRENRMGVASQINDLREALADNWSVTVFPEGTVTDGQSLLPFKTSMLSVLEPPPPGVLVQPVVLDYGPVAEELGWVGDESGVNNARRVLSRKGTFRLDLHFLEPFSPEDFRGRKAIGIEARHRIEAKLVEVLGKPLREFVYPVGPVRYTPRGEAQDAHAGLLQTLVRLREELAQCDDDWWIIGSGAVFLHGAQVENIADIDVMLSARDFERLAGRLGFDRTPEGSNELFVSSAYGRWNELALPVEFMTGLKVHHAGTWRDVVPATRQRIEHAGTHFFAPEAQELIAILEMFGRPKDSARAAALRNV